MRRADAIRRDDQRLCLPPVGVRACLLVQNAKGRRDGECVRTGFLSRTERRRAAPSRGSYATAISPCPSSDRRQCSLSSPAGTDVVVCRAMVLWAIQYEAGVEV